MSSAPAGGAAGGGGGGAVGGALSLMGCVREASPPPQDHHHLSLGEFAMQQRAVDTLPKEPKKRRFHPLRGLRRIFRRKSRGAADARLSSRNGERDGDLITRDREEVTLRHPAGRPEEARSRSASELLTDSCDRESRRLGWPRKYRLGISVRTHKSFNNVFLRRSGVEESFAKLRGGSGQLSVSHDSVFPGEVPHTRPLSSLDPLATLERRQTKASDEGVHKDYASRIPHGNRISLRVLEQIKTVIENRNQLASATSNESTHTSHATGERYQQETTENRFAHFEKHEKNVEETFTRVTRNSEDVTDRENLTPKEDLPQLECASLSHTAAHHRISVRPKNRRPPRRSTTTSNISGSSITTINESLDAPDSLEVSSSNSASSPIEIKGSNGLRKSSIRLSRNSDIFEELEAKLPTKKPVSMASLSPDSLDSMMAIGRNSQEMLTEPEETREIKPVVRKASNRVSKGSDVYEELEAKLPRRRSSSSRLSKSPDSLESGSPASFSKSSEGFEKLMEHEESRSSRKLHNSISKSSDGFEKLTENVVELRPSSRRLHAHQQISKSIEGFDKLIEDEEIRMPVRRFSNVVTSKSNENSLRCSDSLDAIETMGTIPSDDSIERRRSSFELRPRKSPPKLMSMSSENFEALEHHARDEFEMRAELKKRSSISDVNLSRGRRYSKIMSKSTESFDAMETICKQDESNRTSIDLEKNGWRNSKRTTFSSESSDNLELDDRLENRRARRPPKRVPSTSIVDIFPLDNSNEDERRSTPMRKPPRLQKSSESSELGSTDTLDSEKRNKSSDSTETLDSLEKDIEQDPRDEEIPDNLQDKRDTNDSWSANPTEMESANGDEESNRALVSPEKTYWRQTSDSKENFDINQLLAITIVTRMSDNGNNQRNNSAAYPKKKQQQLTSPPSSPVVQQEDNKMMFNNLLASKNDEDLQNMLNGNISEVSTDTKSFKEKLIMFEKLGK
ncbi:uncharacterized protein [Venturia canescens]|uniref:uncharacterized protein n=1 Tax=Venturia canescens TaxID=32260 RepID=UPI001C9CE547|nr:uncharacterized protein LOC122419001 [Venturia canescens]